MFLCTDGALFLDKPAATREKMTDGCAYIYIYFIDHIDPTHIYIHIISHIYLHIYIYRHRDIFDMLRFFNRESPPKSRPGGRYVHTPWD